MRASAAFVGYGSYNTGFLFEAALFLNTVDPPEYYPDIEKMTKSAS